MTEPQQQPNTDDSYDYFQPLVGIKDTFGRVFHVVRQRWKHLLVTSAIPICLWYIIATGIRSVFKTLSLNNVEMRSLELGSGDTIWYQVETWRTTLSRLGLMVEFVLVMFLFLPANAVNLRMIMAGLYAGEDNSNNFSLTHLLKHNLLETLPILPTVAKFCAIWCLTLMLPLLILIGCMAPEGQLDSYYEGIQLYYQPWLPKLVGGLVYLLLSTAFMLASYFCYSILVVKGKKGQAASTIASCFQESWELFQSNWKHLTTILFVWFLVKVAITKVVAAMNWWYYLHEKRFWVVWDQPGIPLLPIRILWSTPNDLWQFGKSWISVPFVIGIAALSSVFQAVLYVDTRIHTSGTEENSCTREMLRTELGLDDSAAAYKTMKNDEEANTNSGTGVMA